MTEQICSAFMCNKTYNDGVELYNFPEDYNPAWIIAVNRGSTWTPKPTSQLCSDHFHEESFELDENAAKRILKLGSEPFLMKGTSPEEEEDKPLIVPKQQLGELNTEEHENKELIDLRMEDQHHQDKDLEEFDKEDDKNLNNVTNGLHFDKLDNSLKTEIPELSGILDTLQKMKNELHDLEVEVKKRSGESWSDNQFQNILSHVKNVEEELESYIKKSQIKSDAAAIPKLEPIDHFPEGVFRLPFDPAAFLESAEASLINIRNPESNLKNSAVGKEELKEFDSEPEDENYDDANYDDELDFDYDYDKPKTTAKKSKRKKTQKTQKTSNSAEKKKKLIVKCVLCSEESCSKWLKTHVLENHGEGPYNCTKCGQTRDTYDEVRKHIKNHFQSEMIKCDICQKEISRQGMSAHKRSHTDTEEPCKKCGKYIMPIYMGRHMKEAHEEWRHLKCDFCEKKFAQPDHLKVHLRMHTGERPYSCETCGKSFKQGPHLRTHIKIVHEGLKLKYNNIKAMCGTCGKILLSKKSLQRHERTHTGEKPFKCEKCDKAFTQMSSLTSHRDVHNTSRLYSCEKCGKSMKFKQTLTAHMKIHEPGYVAKTYTCEACSITYKAKLNLRRHIRVFHEGIKPYPCEVCKQAFSNTTTLKQHMRVHTGEKPFHCDICNKSFTQASSLYSHKKKCN